MTTYINELRDLGLLNVDYPNDLRETVEKAVASWKTFCRRLA